MAIHNTILTPSNADATDTPPAATESDPSSPVIDSHDDRIAPLAEMHVDVDLQDDVAALDWDSVDESAFWPELKEAFKVFQRGSTWGTVWISLIDLFLVFEEMAGFLDDSKIKLPTNDCPSVIADFMCQRRNWSEKWPVGDLDVFSPLFWKWWRSLQPNTRIHEDRLIKPDFVDWDSLQDKSGRNGMSLVIGALLWWGEAVSDLTDEAGSARREDWVLAVADVTWALDNMIRHATFRKVSCSAKRTAAEANMDKENAPLSKASSLLSVIKPNADNSS
ncbi:hypothetical protein CPB85DRAFT_1439994 [Mucidula mucida]|nr:hypothetical protein CPB85DRAFT_1439994 [Mucidula mucida]